jgi:hypothetical protein
MEHVYKFPGSQKYPNYVRVIIIACTLVLAAGAGVSAATTSLHIQKTDGMGNVLSDKYVDYTWMETNLPVYGDGTTHYYHQGPVFVDNAEDRWNAAEDKNVLEKDMGAVKGTSLKDLCDLAGGMDPGDTVTLKAGDGFSKTFAYQNVYEPQSRQGPMVITWYRQDEGYVPDYRTGMRLVFFADSSVNPWGIHAFGNWDWHESADPSSYYFYVQGSERYPTTTGLSVQDVSGITIKSPLPKADSESLPSATSVPLGPLLLIAALFSAVALFRRRNN